MESALKKNFFVSYNHKDEAAAERIAAILENAGYSVIIQVWDCLPGDNFVQFMDRATAIAERTIAVLSPNYLTSQFTPSEWQAAFVQDPKGEKRQLIPVRVEACEVTGLLRPIVYIELVGVAEAKWQEELLRKLFTDRRERFGEGMFPALRIPQNLPRVNPVFVGREEALEALHLQLKADVALAISSIQGMGGIGKTELALQYARKHLEAGDYPGGVCWLRGREELGTQIVGFARSRFGLEIPIEVELAEQVRICWREWQKGNALIVFDDVQAYEQIEAFLPPQGEQFRVLLTTRKYLGGSVQNYEITVLSEAAALELLRRLVRDGRIDRELARSRELCEWLGYLPLGLELMGRYLARKKGLSIEKLWGRLQDDRLEAEALEKVEAGMTAKLNVIKAFELSWEELTTEARRLAMLLSVFALAEISWEWVQACLPEVDEEALEGWRDEQLVNLSLLGFEGEGRYQLHQLLREFFVMKMEAAERVPLKRAVAGVMIGIAKQIPQDPTLEIIGSVTGAIPHLQAVAEDLMQLKHRDECGIADDDDLTWVFTGISWFYQGQGLYGDAEPWCIAGLEVARSLLGVCQ